MTQKPPSRPAEPANGHRAAHERLSTGALARWTRACATHPWRVVGDLGRHRRRPDRARRRGRRQPEGRVRDPGVGHAEGDRPDRGRVRVRAGRRAERRLRRARRAAARHARAQGGDRGGDRGAQDAEFKPTEDTAGIESVGDPFSADTFSDDGRIAYAEAQFDRIIYDEDRDAVVAVQDAVREAVEPAGVTVEFNGDAEFPPIEQGTAGAARPARGAHRAARRLPDVRRGGDPDRARARRRSRPRSCCSSSSPA